MDVNFAKAANAYASRMQAQDAGEDGADETASTGEGSFTNMLKGALESVANTQHNAEALKMQAVTGKVDMADLVTAVSTAELTLNTVVAIRDRVITAYQDIIRMPI